MAKRSWTIFGAAAVASFIATALAASHFFEMRITEQGFAQKAWSFSWPFFPGFAVTAATMFALLRNGIARSRSFFGSLLRCWLIAGVTATLTPIWPFFAYALQRGDNLLKDPAFFEVVASLGFVIALPFSIPAGLFLTFALHRSEDLDSKSLNGAKLPTSVFFP